jgi:hypothetical protein
MWGSPLMSTTLLSEHMKFLYTVRSQKGADDGIRALTKVTVIGYI